MKTGDLKDLFEAVREGAGLDYISDLHNKMNFRLVKSSIENVDADSYPVEQWLMMYDYIFKDGLAGESAGEIKARLMKLMR
ncbi:MAG: hypothetical protein Q4D04_07320 [Clostridia bacterium]|nr:hypothetical protein [Clostridia bacterium]